MPLNGQASKLGPLSSSRSSLNNAEYYQPKPIFRETYGFRLLTIVLAPPQCVDRQSVDRQSIDYQFIDDPSTDDPSTDDPSTILLAEFYNIDPQFIDRSGTSTAGFLRQLLPGPDLLQAYFWG
jgi:hypothetical protein